MKTSNRFRSVLAAGLVLVSASVALAPVARADDDDHRCTLAAGAQPLPASQAIRIGESLGYTVFDYGIDDGCIELRGTDPNGARVKLTLDPVSGAVLPTRHR